MASAPRALAAERITNAACSLPFAATMDDELRYALPCRLALLAGAVLHWVAAALLIMDMRSTSSNWEYSSIVRRLASNCLQTFMGG